MRLRPGSSWIDREVGDCEDAGPSTVREGLYVEGCCNRVTGIGATAILLRPVDEDRPSLIATGVGPTSVINRSREERLNEAAGAAAAALVAGIEMSR